MTKNFKFALGVFLTLVSTQAYADECASVKVKDDACKADSLSIDLSKCEDKVISVRKPKCTAESISVYVRGRDNDYRIVMKKSDSAWGTDGGWLVDRLSKIEHQVSKKTLPETQHERPKPASAVVEIKAADAKPNESKTESAFIFSAYFDAYFEHNFNRPAATTSSGGGSLRTPQNALRYYDFYNDQLSLNLAEITIKHIRKETSFIVDLDFGTFAEANVVAFTGNASGAGTAPSTVDEVTKHIGQAVFTYTPSSIPGFTFEAGKMPTHVGLELMKAKDNWNYTRSTLFSYGGPFWHTGMHFGYAVVPGQLTANAYLYNGWGTVYDDNVSPTYGAQLKWSPSERFTWIYNYIGGPESASNSSDWKQVHESNVSYSLTPTLSAAADFLYGKLGNGVATGDASWYGAQLGFKWQTSPGFYLSPRVEFFRDSDGFALGGTRQTLKTYTLTESVLLSDGLELRIEERLDHSTNHDRFIKRNGESDIQPTVLFGLLYTM